ncbi:GPI transamidase component PIG-S-like [Acipenser oxyrinchus oxyrinchus]|uniref:GPI transamidase component PIG-S-like n=1 Tax=Acipenser oxyrinchus oxyrinchus TaxID=40147 RepID=A0AAD8FU96_ACIOX|nr:GPI transamidase component PIG-S-like [Acipenser oxyrinchus oxyrinchus]
MAAVAGEKRRGRNAALSIAAIAIVVGLPLWWKTTETYRASLPYTQISELDTLQLQLTVELEVVFSKGSLTAEQQKTAPLQQTREAEHLLNSKTELRYKYETKYRTATVMEDDAVRLESVEEADVSLSKLNESPSGSLVIYVIPETSALLPQGVSVYVGKHRTALLRTPQDRGAKLVEVLRGLQPDIQRVVETMSFSDVDIKAALSDRVPVGKLGKESLADSMRTFKSSPGYEITFSLLNPDPKSHDVRWDIEGALESYIQPLLSKLSGVANFSVDSQILYYAILGVTPRYDSKVSSYTLNAENLPHVINPVEARLGSNAASSHPVLNFLLYVPDYPHSPLYIKDRGGDKVPTNAFHSPRWGGIMVYNVNEKYTDPPRLPVHISINMVRVMEVFLAQLRLLLGVQQPHAPADFLLQSPGNEGLTDWELDRLLWVRTVENIATATTTLTSLAQLLDEIGNIVINDNIASEVYSAVTSIQAAIAELESCNLGLAFQASKEATLSSEKAFFDPSLLHLLYFPDDQKFAIYIPLFLPMSVPILLSLLKIASELRERRKEPAKID